MMDVWWPNFQNSLDRPGDDDTHHFGTLCFTKEETEVQISYAGFEFSLALKLNELYCHTTLTDFCMKITDK